MTEMRRVPATMTHEQLLAVLDHLRAGAASGDTLEGSIEFLAADEPRTYDVMAAYRIGNLEGQGGMRLIGEFAEGPDEW